MELMFEILVWGGTPQHQLHRGHFQSCVAPQTKSEPFVESRQPIRRIRAEPCFLDFCVVQENEGIRQKCLLKLNPRFLLKCTVGSYSQSSRGQLQSRDGHRHLRNYSWSVEKQRTT